MFAKSVLEPRTVFGKEGDFRRRGLAPEDGIAVRKVAEPRDDIGMPARPCERFRQAGFPGQCAEQRERALLRIAIFSVLERHVQEPAAIRGEFAIESAINGFPSRRERPRVTGKGLRSPAVDVARELVEEQHTREGTLGIDAPRAIATGKCKRHHGREAVADFRVELRILVEPDIARGETLRGAAGTEPEIEDRQGEGISGIGVHGS